MIIHRERRGRGVPYPLPCNLDFLFFIPEKNNTIALPPRRRERSACFPFIYYITIRIDLALSGMKKTIHCELFIDFLFLYRKKTMRLTFDHVEVNGRLFSNSSIKSNEWGRPRYTRKDEIW